MCPGGRMSMIFSGSTNMLKLTCNTFVFMRKIQFISYQHINKSTEFYPTSIPPETFLSWITLRRKIIIPLPSSLEPLADLSIFINMAAFLFLSACICFSLLALDNLSLAAWANLSFSFSSAENIRNLSIPLMLKLILSA